MQTLLALLAAGLLKSISLIAMAGRAHTLLVVAGLALSAASGLLLFVYFGVYNVAATEQHTAPVYWLLDVAMRRSVRSRAEDIDVPALTDRGMIEQGLRLYKGNCVQCHGAPGVAPDAAALGLTPLPANLVLTARDWKPAELYWIVSNGAKMTGMPAWKFRLSEDHLWSIVAFLRVLPALSPADYQAMAAFSPGLYAGSIERQPDPARPGDAERGKIAFQQYACTTCHVIPGVVGATKPVGPPLAGIASRKYLAGILPNTEPNMILWLRAPQAVDPLSAMPDLGVSEADARDMAAYLAGID